MSAPGVIHEQLDHYWDFLRQERISGEMIIRFLGGERVGKTEFLTRHVERAATEASRVERDLRPE